MFLGAILAAALVNAQSVPERMDDFCWENEFCGMRVRSRREPTATDGLKK